MILKSFSCYFSYSGIDEIYAIEFEALDVLR
jgi:hypothetical protein